MKSLKEFINIEASLNEKQIKEAKEYNEDVKKFGLEILKFIEKNKKDDVNYYQYVHDFGKELNTFLYNQISGSKPYSAFYDGVKDFVEENKEETYVNWKK